MERDYENTLMPTLESNGLSQITFYGLARGFLTGKYRKGKIVESVRPNGVNTSYSNNRGWTMIEKVDQIAKDKTLLSQQLHLLGFALSRRLRLQMLLPQE